MRITLFTSNQVRHLALIQDLAALADEVFVVQETKTSFAGKRPAIHAASDVMARYFAHVRAAERAVFGVPHFTPPNVRTMALFMGDLSDMPLEAMEPALHSDAYIVFGASYIRGELVDFLVERRTVNIHMGLSPYYRGSACNFWAMYDRSPVMVGATLHLLTKGLDSGPVLRHVLPRRERTDGFTLGMRAVRAAQRSLVTAITSGELATLEPVRQDKTLERRYTRSRDFVDGVADAYLASMMTEDEIEAQLAPETRDFWLKDPVFL